jgi:hypothetical protein
MAGLIMPRLLVAEESAVDRSTQYQLRRGPQAGPVLQLADGVLPDGRRGVLVVEARADDLVLTVR